MQLRSLKHVIEAVQALVHPDEVIVMGSSALLPLDASLGETGQPLELSLDADLLLHPTDDALATVVHEAVGEGSLFHREFGVYVDLLRPEISETLPPEWRDRCIEVPGLEHALCLDVHDLAVAKLCAGREKDVALLQYLLTRGLLDIEVLRGRFQSTPLDERLLFRAGRVLNQLSESSEASG